MVNKATGQSKLQSLDSFFFLEDNIEPFLQVLFTHRKKTLKRLWNRLKKGSGHTTLQLEFVVQQFLVREIPHMHKEEKGN